MIDLYEARQYLGLDTLKETGLRMPVRVYFKDPAVAQSTEGAGIDDTNSRRPGSRASRDGPTSARFAVVDYDATKNVLTPPAIWNRDERTAIWRPTGRPFSMTRRRSSISTIS